MMKPRYGGRPLLIARPNYGVGHYPGGVGASYGGVGNYVSVGDDATIPSTAGGGTCDAGQVWNDFYGSCVNACPSGQVYNASGVCIASGGAAPSGGGGGGSSGGGVTGFLTNLFGNVSNAYVANQQAAAAQYRAQQAAAAGGATPAWLMPVLLVGGGAVLILALSGKRSSSGPQYVVASNPARRRRKRRIRRHRR